MIGLLNTDIVSSPVVLPHIKPLPSNMLKPVFRIRDILQRIRILGLRIRIWFRILLFSSVVFRMPTKNKFSCSLFSLSTFTPFFKNNKSLRNHKTGEIKVFSFFCLLMQPDPYKYYGSGSCGAKTYGSFGSRTLVTTRPFSDAIKP